MSVFGILRVAMAAMLVAPAFAQDADGSKDHPLVGRYEGSTIQDYKDNAYDQAFVLVAPNDWTSKVPNNRTDHSGSEWLALEGRVVQIRYIPPEGRSSLEIYRNYQLALKAKGFEPVFDCMDAKCFVGDHDALPYQLGELFDQKSGNSLAYWDHSRYLLAKYKGEAGAIYAMIVVGEKDAKSVTFVEVIETKEMESDKIVVKTAEEMGDGIGQMGSVNIYTLFFDFDKADLQPASAPTLDEITKLLTQDPKLKLNIVGHTDNKGEPGYNLDLSKRRATAVVAALVNTRGIAADRLTSDGMGASKPIATNDTDEGRARNRRVELVRIP